MAHLSATVKVDIKESESAAILTVGRKDGHGVMRLLDKLLLMQAIDYGDERRRYAIFREGGSRKALRTFDTFAAGIDGLFAVAAAYIRGEE